ncbi:proton-coupled folate transporter-like [Brachionus plicatilis]|uniref:Proton-coupled folate transporter-like n=1 Tax=Brachionus plicatilis TaxID=10195 RepID=A0A3M7QZY7_BRAPC|nr:proton-coupled folate transporter-like [Brachionus plicatilis]
MLNTGKALSDYGSINDANMTSSDDLTKSSDYYTTTRRNKKRPKPVQHSDSFLNYLTTNPGSFNGIGFNRESIKSIVIDDTSREDFSQSSTELIISQTICHTSYIVEPVAFIQNLANSIMSISLGQFIYTRILERLIEQFNKTNFVSVPKFFYSFTNSSCQASPTPIHNLSTIFFKTTSSNHIIANWLHSEHSFGAAFTGAITPDEFEIIRTQAQAETAKLYFMSSIFCGIPVIIMTNILGVNCSTLGRKTLMLIYLFVMSLKYILLLFQCLNPSWPDWLFYVGAFIEGVSGSAGVFFLSLYCYIADLTSPASRSYRITLLNNLNSLATLCVTFVCGYVIKYFGYFYLFFASVILMLISFFYTLLLIPEPLIDLHHTSLVQRIKKCSIKRTINCFRVYFSKESKKCKTESSRLLDPNNNPDEIIVQEHTKLSKQTFVLLLIVFANFIYCFGSLGIGSIFTLFLMNKPYCFDSVQISNYSVFATIVSLVASLLVSKFLKVNDLIICILSVLSYFVSVLCYIFGNSTDYIYLGAVVASISGLEYGYIRSIVSKSVEKNEVADALSLILIVDTFVAVVSNVLFPILYSTIVSKGINILFAFSNGFVLIALVCHIINYFVYKPVKVSDASSGVRTRPSVRKRYVSLMNLSESDEDSDSKDLDKISRVLI